MSINLGCLIKASSAKDSGWNREISKRQWRPPSFAEGSSASSMPTGIVGHQKMTKPKWKNFKNAAKREDDHWYVDLFTTQQPQILDSSPTVNNAIICAGRRKSVKDYQQAMAATKACGKQVTLQYAHGVCRIEGDENKMKKFPPLLTLPQNRREHS